MFVEVKNLFPEQTHLHHGLKHGDEDELDEADLSRRLGDLFSVHERSHRKPLGLLPVALSGKRIYMVLHLLHCRSRI